MLERLDDVAWGKLKHAYGAADDVPELLRQLASPDADARDAALDALYGNIVHQGTLYSATPKAVPFVIEIVEHGRSADRAALLVLLAVLATAAPEQHAYDSGFDASKLTGVYRATHVAVARGAPLFARLAGHGDARVRAAAAYACAMVPSRAAEVVESLQGAATQEAVLLTRASLLLALGYVARAARPWAVRVDDLFAAAMRDANAVVRGAAACARALALDDAIDDATVAALAEAAALPRVDASALPWDDGRIAGIAIRQLRRLRARAGDASVEAMFAALERLPIPKMPLDVADRVECAKWQARSDACSEVMLTLFTPSTEDRLLGELTAQRRALTRLAEAPDAASNSGLADALRTNGIPARVVDLPRYLGEAPGPLDRPLGVDGRVVPAWWALRAYRRGVVGANELVAALRRLSAEERVAIVDDVASEAYRIRDVARGFVRPVEDVLTGVLRDAGDDAAAALEALADRLLGGHPYRLRRAMFALRVFVEARGETLEPRFDRLIALLENIDVAAARRALAGLPLARREAIVLSLPFVEAEADGVPTALGAWTFADLAPTPAVLAKVEERVRGWSRKKKMPRARADEVLRALRKGE